jgi:hypothetical protein
MKSNYALEEPSSNLRRRIGLHTRNEVTSFRKFVDDHHYHIPLPDERPCEIDGESMPSMRRNGKRLVKTVRFGTSFVELAFVA